MKKYKVICITSGATDHPQKDRNEKEIEYMTEQGWDFVQFTSGGGGSGNGNVTSWIYLLFESEL